MGDVLHLLDTTTERDTNTYNRMKASVFNWTVVVWILKKGQLFFYKKKKNRKEGTRKESRDMYGDRSYEGKRETDETETQWEKRHKK